MTPITIASPNPVPARFACGAYQYDRIVVYSPSGGPSETKSERIADAPGPENDLGVFRHRDVTPFSVPAVMGVRDGKWDSPRS